MKTYLLLALVPALAFVIALWQQVRVRIADQTPWKGGGYGMFATNDSGSNRFARVYLQAGGVSYAADLPEKAVNAQEEFLAAPKPAAMDAFADKLRPLYWLKKNELSVQGMKQIPAPYKPMVISPEALLIEYWKVAYNPQSGSLSANKQYDKRFDLSKPGAREAE